MEWTNRNDLWVLRLDDGEDLVESLGKFIGLPEVPDTLAVLSGLGMLKQVELGFFSGEGYETHTFMDPSELLSVSGSIFRDAEPFLHMHLVLGFRDASVAGGHLVRARACNTLELFLLSSDLRLGRKARGELRVIDFEPDAPGETEEEP
jgi:predicted DNA-binding protein with PD1-like motif